MSSPKPDNTAKVESSTEIENVQSQQDNPDSGNFQHHGGGHGGGQGGGQGGRRGGGGNRFGGGGDRFGGGGDRFGGGGGGFRRQPNNMNGENNEFFGRKRMTRGGGNIGPRDQGGPMNRYHDDRINDKLAQMAGPTFDFPPLDTSEKKFSGRSRLYIGNIPPEAADEEINEMFKQYGETSELFINKEKNFGFVRLDFFINAEKAKRELDGTLVKGRNLKIRFAPNGSSIKVKNLSAFVSNELLHWAFSVFGEIERCIVIVDDRGKPTGEGIVEFIKKGSASLAIRKCAEGCFFLTASLRPVIVEQYDAVDEVDGYSDKNIVKKNHEYLKAREIGPRFANRNSFEHEYGMRWKQLHELYAQKEQALHKELESEKEKLEAQMEYARYEHETEMLREELRAREMDRERQKHEWEMKERKADEIRQRNEEQMRRQQDDMKARISLQEEELRRRQQENSLFMQAHELDNMLDEQEQTFEPPKRGAFIPKLNPDIGAEGDMPMDPKQFMNTFDRNHRFEGRDMGARAGGNIRGGKGHWVNENRGGGNRDDFQNKRRRY